MVLANLAGALILMVFVRYVLPLPAADLQYARALNLVLFGGYLGLSVVIGSLVGLRILRPVIDWRRRGGPRPRWSSARCCERRFVRPSCTP